MFALTLNLYTVVSLPRAFKNGTLSTKYYPLPEYLAVVADRQSFVKLSEAAARTCLARETTICPIRGAVERKRKKKACATAIFAQDQTHSGVHLDHRTMAETYSRVFGPPPLGVLHGSRASVGGFLPIRKIPFHGIDHSVSDGIHADSYGLFRPDGRLGVSG